MEPLRIADISRKLWEIQNFQTEVDRIRYELMPYVDLDDEQLQLFAEYVADLQKIGVNLQDEQLQDALNAYPQNIEAAVQAVLDYTEQLQQKHQAFVDSYQATDYLTNALQDSWEPN